MIKQIGLAKVYLSRLRGVDLVPEPTFGKAHCGPWGADPYHTWVTRQHPADIQRELPHRTQETKCLPLTITKRGLEDASW
jgi:hypothetical protein